jgi:hypothetical protein
MADLFTILIQNLNSLGFYNFLLPWLFVFAVVYGLLAKADLFGGQNSRVSALLGIIIAFFVASFYGPTIATFFTSLFGGATYVLAFILVAVLFIAMSGFKIGELTGANGKRWPVLLFLVVLAIIVFMVATGTVISGIALNESAIAAIFVVAILLLAVWFVVGKGEEKKSTQPGQAPG